MSLLGNYIFRNFVKEKIMQVYASFEYAANHPYSTLNKMAHDSSVAFILEHCPRAVAARSPKKLMDIALSKVSLNGLYLEFGVFKGESIRYIAKNNPGKQIHGFDSFQGLPEQWAHNPEGAFTTHGKMPKVPANVKLWKGYFEDSLPGWCKQYSDSIAFLHIDCDLRSSTATILECLTGRIHPGTVIVLDDYFNFPGWEEDGHAVLTDFLGKNNLSAEYIGYGFKELAIIIRAQ
ncbi:MAG: class I SAM-dependent methyltransferase [Desulfobulbaceae bacterium]|nr:class I SAM-dependent methyltransferase [Desulfobulbaceae bacterium]